MKKIILIVEDLIEEQQKAKDAVIGLGCSPVVAGNLEDAIRMLNQLKSKIHCVVTDLHFPASERLKEEKPNGLAVVAVCVESGIRVGVCSDINHHFSEYLKIPIQVFESHQLYQFSAIPFSEDNKEWKNIIEKTVNL